MEEDEKVWKSEGAKNIRRTKPSESTEYTSYQLTETEEANMESAFLCAGSSAQTNVISLVSVEFLSVGLQASLTLSPALGALFLLLGCLVQLQCDGFLFYLTRFHSLCLVVISYKPILF